MKHDWERDDQQYASKLFVRGVGKVSIRISTGLKREVFIVDSQKGVSISSERGATFGSLPRTTISGDLDSSVDLIISSMINIETEDCAKVTIVGW